MEKPLYLKKESKELSQWAGFIQCKCPRCRKGDVFQGSVWNFKKQTMLEICSHCGLKYEREPGYFYVAMFVSYGFNVAEVITTTVAAYILGLALTFDNLDYYIGLALGVSLLCSLINFRYSRMVLLYWLSPGLRYEPDRAKD
jgi:uncharacterized protein (DUF983 family)